MQKPDYKGREEYFGILCRSKPRDISTLLSFVDIPTIKVIVEILLNILKGSFSLTEKETDYAKKKYMLCMSPKLVKYMAKLILEFI